MELGTEVLDNVLRGCGDLLLLLVLELCLAFAFRLLVVVCAEAVM